MVNFYLFCLLAAAACVTGSIVKTNNKNSSTFELLILHNNDMHARFEQTSQLSGACTIADRDAGKCYGGFPRVAHVVKEARRAASVGEGPPVLYLNAGDTYTGTAWFTIYKWKIAAEFINALQPDAVSLGNHELDEGVDGLIPFIGNVTTPVLAANLLLDKVTDLRAEDNLKKSIVITVNGVKVGVIGYLTPDTKFLAPSNDVEYEDEVPAIRREVDKLKGEGVNIFIALGHSGFLADLRIAKEVEDIDLVIGGHSNTFLLNGKTSETPEVPQGPYPTVVKQASERSVLVVQAYAFTKYLGKLLLTFDSDGEIIHFNGQPILLDNDIPRDPEVAETVRRYHKEMEIISNEVVGTSLEMLDGECRLRQCNLGNLITDAILEYTKERNICVSIAVEQGGRIRASIQHDDEHPMKLTKGDWLAVQPFSDSLAIIAVNGSVLLRALEHSVDTWRKVDCTGQFLQFSGMQVVYDLARPPGSRIVSAKAIATIDASTCEETALVEIQEEMMYRIVLPIFLAEGGDGFHEFLGRTVEVLSYNELTPIFSYLEKHSPVNPSISDRLVILNEDKVQTDTVTVDPIKQRSFPSSADSVSFSVKLIFLVNVFAVINIL